MRTTVTLEPDVAAMIDQRMRERGLPFKQVLNDAIRAALSDRGDAAPYRVRVRGMGVPQVPLTRALALAAELEDEEIVRKLALGK